MCAACNGDVVLSMPRLSAPAAQQWNDVVAAAACCCCCCWDEKKKCGDVLIRVIREPAPFYRRRSHPLNSLFLFKFYSNFRPRRNVNPFG